MRNTLINPLLMCMHSKDMQRGQSKELEAWQFDAYQPASSLLQTTAASTSTQSTKLRVAVSHASHKR